MTAKRHALLPRLFAASSLRSLLSAAGALLLGALLVSAPGCQRAEATFTDRARARASDPELLHRSVGTLTDVMVRDIFSPPQASRVYAYASVAAYEALRPERMGRASLAGTLNGLGPVPPPDTSAEDTSAEDTSAGAASLFSPIAGVHAFLTVGEAMVYSTARLASFHEKMHARLRKRGVPEAVRERSAAYGEKVARHILDWAARDRYKETRSGERFTVTGEPGRWRPTPPAYMNAINPNWDEIRPFVVDASAQFKPPRPVPYSMEKGSPFYEQVREVYEIGKNLTEEEREIAAFWDCNPYAISTHGHAKVATKQMTPGGHWMAIATIASRKTNAGLMRSASAYARLAVTLADGFISAWDEKYRSDLVRPVTVINEHFDEGWRPLLQTPPFPEYTSAHSVISAAAAVTLTDAYGESFAFRDTSEVGYGLPVRSFDSFNEAAREAAVSRLYGGIHYRMAAKNGFDQGKRLGRFVVEQLPEAGPAKGTKPPSVAAAPSSP